MTFGRRRIGAPNADRFKYKRWSRRQYQLKRNGRDARYTNKKTPVHRTGVFDTGTNQVVSSPTKPDLLILSLLRVPAAIGAVAAGACALAAASSGAVLGLQAYCGGFFC